MGSKQMSSLSNERAQSVQKNGVKEELSVNSQDRSMSKTRMAMELSQGSMGSIGSTESSRVRQRFNRKVKGVKHLNHGYKFTTSLDVNRGETNSALKRQKVYRENQEERLNRQNLLEIKRIILTPKHSRTKEE